MLQQCVTGYPLVVLSLHADADLIASFIINTQATEKDPMDSGDDGARFSPLFAFCLIPLSPLSTAQSAYPSP
jgi:hypothetical protein